MWIESGLVHRSGRVVLDGSGNGTITFDVQHANQRWLLESVVVSQSGASPGVFPQVTLNVGGSNQGNSQGASWFGNQETFQGSIDMTAGDTLTVQFATGTAGATCSAVIDGKNYLWR